MKTTKITEEITLEDGYRATIRRQEDGQIEEITWTDGAPLLLRPR